MNKNIFHKFKEIRLDPERKKDMRAYFVRIIEAEGSRARRFGRGKRPFLTRVLNALPLIASVLYIILVGAGTSFAAESSVPGDLLYAVKIGVNEVVLGAFASSPKAKADFEVKLATRRITEAATLARQNKLSAPVASSLEAQFNKHSKNAQAKIAELETQGNVAEAAESASDFEASLNAHGQVLQSIEDQSSGSDPLQPLSASLSSAFDDVSGVRADLEVKVGDDNGSSTRRAAEARIKTAGENIVKTRSFLGRGEIQAGSERATNAEIQLSAAEDLAREAQTEFDTGSYDTALTFGSRATRIAQESKTLLDEPDDVRVGSDATSSVPLAGNSGRDGEDSGVQN